MGEGEGTAGTGEEKNPLLEPYQMGEFKLAHKIVMAPMTRCRGIDTFPVPAMQEYYTQRATGGLIITEATPVCVEGQGYPHVPGIYLEEQVEKWKPIVAAVKAKKTTFFMQLWHVGRASHPDFQPNGAKPVSSTNKPVSEGQVYTTKGAYEYKDFPPRALETHEIPGIVEQFRVGARNAIRAGFDGVEIHGAHGYLLDQFLKDGINDRTDEYGGSLENRCRFPLEVVKAVTEEAGAHRTGIRLSPYTEFLDATTSDANELMAYFVAKLNDFNLLYIHCVEPRIDKNMQVQVVDPHSKKDLLPFRQLFKNTFMAAGGYSRESAIQALKEGRADLIVFGRLFLANPDLPRRLELNAPLNKYDRNTFYTQDPVKGYTDYPFLDESKLTAEMEAVKV